MRIRIVSLVVLFLALPGGPPALAQRAQDRPAPPEAPAPGAPAAPGTPPQPGQAPPAPVPAAPAAPAPSLTLGEAIPFTIDGLDREAKSVAADLERATDPKTRERLEHELKVVQAGLETLRSTAALPAEESAVAERERRAGDEARRIAAEAAKPLVAPSPLPPRALEDAREEERKLKTVLATLESTLKTAESAPERFRAEQKALEQSLAELEAGKREILERLGQAKTDEEKTALRRRLAIRDVNIAYHTARIAYLGAYIDLARKDLPLRRAERDNVAQLAARATSRLQIYLVAEEERLARERTAAEEEVKRLDVLKRYGRPFEVTRGEAEAAVAKEKIAHQELKELENRWGQRYHRLMTQVQDEAKNGAELVERLHGPSDVEARTTITLARLDEATRRARLFYQSELARADREAQADLARLRALRDELKDLRLRLPTEHEAQAHKAKAQYDELHEKHPRIYTEAYWAAEAKRWNVIKEERLSLVSEREATLERAIDQLVLVEELASKEAARVRDAEVLVRSRAFWLREEPIVDPGKLRPVFDEVLAEYAAGRAALRDRTVFFEALAALGKPAWLARLAGVLVGAFLVFLTGRRRFNAFLQAKLKHEVPHPISLGSRLRRGGLRLVEAAGIGAELTAVALLAVLLLGGRVSFALLWASLLVLGSRAAAQLLRVVFRPHEPEWRLIPMPDDVAALIYRVGMRFLTIAAVAMIAWMGALALGPEAAASVRGALWLVVRDLAILVLLLSLASQVVTGRVLGLFSKPLARRLRRPLVLVGLFIACCIIAIFVLEALGYRNAAESVTGSLLLSIAIFGAAIVVDRGLYLVVVSRLDPHGVEQEAAADEGDDEEPGSPAARRRFLKEAVGMLVAAVVFVGVVAGLFLAFEAERATLDNVLSLPIVDLDSEGLMAVTVRDVLGALLTVLVTLIVYRYFRGFVAHYVLTEVGLSRGARFAITSVAGYTIMGVGLVLALRRLHINIGELEWFLAAAGVGIGFGLQEILSNFVSGLIILIERPIEVGDIVTVKDVDGEVVRITIRATTVLTGDNVSIIVPNKEFITTSVTNWSHGDPSVRLRIPVGVAYGSNVHLVRKTLLDVADGYGRLMKHPQPEVDFRGFGASSLDFELLVWLPVPDPDLRRRVVSDLCAAIDAAFRRNHIEIPFNQVDLHVRQGETLVVGQAPPSQAAAAELSAGLEAPPPKLPAGEPADRFAVTRRRLKPPAADGAASGGPVAASSTSGRHPAPPS